MKTTSAKGYIIIFACLIGMAILNIVLSEIDLDGWNTTVALTIACTQAFLLGAFFMHLREAPRFMWVVVFSGIFFVGTLAVYVVADNYGRSKQVIPQTWELPEAVRMPAVPVAK